VVRGLITRAAELAFARYAPQVPINLLSQLHCAIIAPLERINQIVAQHHARPVPLDRFALQTGHQFQQCVLQDHTTMLQALRQSTLAFCAELDNFKTAPDKCTVIRVLRGRIATAMDLLRRCLVMLARAIQILLQRNVSSALLGSINLKKGRYFAIHVHQESTATHLVCNRQLEIVHLAHFQIAVQHPLLAQFVQPDFTAIRQD
jgi:hypothetical protein